MRNSLDQKGRGEGEKRESRKQNEYRKQTGTGERKSEWERVRGEKPEALNCCGGRHCNFPLYTFLRSSCRALSLSLSSFKPFLSPRARCAREPSFFDRPKPTFRRLRLRSLPLFTSFSLESLDGSMAIIRYICVYIYKSISSVRLVQSVMQSGSLIDRPFRCPIKLVLFEFFFFSPVLPMRKRIRWKRAESQTQLN